MEKEYFQMILESIDSKLDLVLEGHAALDQKFDRKFDQLNEKIDHNSFLIQTLNQKIDGVEDKLTQKIESVEQNLTKKIDAVADDLKAHRADTEAHHGVYRVKEG